MFPVVKPRGTLRSRGEISLFPAGPVIKCFVIPSNLKVEKDCEEIVCFKSTGSQICRSFKEHDLITCESKAGSSCCFPRQLVSFDPWHVTRFPPIGKRI